MSRTYRRKDDWMGWKRWLRAWEACIWLQPELYFYKFMHNPKRYNLDCYNSRIHTKYNKVLKHLTARKYRTCVRDCLRKFKTNATDIEMSKYYRYEDPWNWF